MIETRRFTSLVVIVSAALLGRDALCAHAIVEATSAAKIAALVRGLVRNALVPCCLSLVACRLSLVACRLSLVAT